MSSIRVSSIPVLASALLAALLAAGCAAPPRAERYIPPPIGSSWAYARTATGSFGTGSTTMNVSLESVTWEGRPALGFRSAGGTQVNNLESGMMALLSPQGQVGMRFDPPIGFGWPLEVGRTWTTKHVATVPASGRSYEFTSTWKVEAYEEVSVPAGRFKTFRVSYADTTGESHVLWAAPETLGVFPKRTMERTAQHPQGAGTATLEMVRVPSLK